MAYKVLYRKYRPVRFEDVVGQPQVTVTLRNELQAGRISHAYLFTGTRGTGKTTCAKILAKAVNCLNPQNGDPCGECEICRGLDSGSILDVVEIDAASNNGVDSIRSLIEEVNFTPGSAKYRVYIIDEVHMLSAAAFNALLKTLEEPPPHVIFIMATTEVHKLLPTILSRCQRFDFKRITPNEIADRIEYVCSCENVSIERDASLLIARIADGGMRDALSILDQCIGRSDNITVQVVNETAGIVGRDYLFNLAQAIKDRKCSDALTIINELHENSKDMGRLCEEMSDHFRKLMLIKTMKDPSALITASAEEMDALTEQAVTMSLSAIVHSMDTFQTAMDKMKYSDQRIETEMAFIRLCSPELDSTPEALIRRIEALEQGISRVPVKVTAPTETKAEVKSKPVPEPASSGNQRSAEDLVKDAVPFTDWPEVIQHIKQYSQSVAAAFSGSAAYTSGNYILVDASPFAFDLLRGSAATRDKIKECIAAVTGKPYNIGPYKGGKVNKKTEKDDPLKSLEKRAEEAGIEIIEN